MTPNELTPTGSSYPSAYHFSGLNRLSTTVAKLSAADSRIRDVDVAEETAAMTRTQILAQAGVSVLAKANQAPSVALSLLR